MIRMANSIGVSIAVCELAEKKLTERELQLLRIVLFQTVPVLGVNIQTTFLCTTRMLSKVGWCEKCSLMFFRKTLYEAEVKFLSQ